MKKYRLPVLYVLLLSLCLPLAYLGMYILGLFLETASKDNLSTLFYAALAVIALYWLCIVILGILNIRESFRAFRSGDSSECINKMLIHKYGLVLFFAVNFCILFFWFTFGSLAVVAGTRGLALFAAPVLLPGLIIAVIWSIFATWLAMFPGAFYGIQVIRLSYKAQKISAGGLILHSLLQFIFMADVLDAMYLAAVKWNRARKSSAVICILYILMVIGTLWLVFKLRNMNV